MECSICLENVTFFHTLTKLREKLYCGHVFHKNCIQQVKTSVGAAVCPNCRSPILDTNEQQLLRVQYSEKKLNELLDNADDRELRTWLTLSYRNESFQPLFYFILQHYDLTNVLKEEITTGQMELVLYIILNGKINWHKTFQGNTFLDLVKDQQLKTAVLTKCPNLAK